LAAPEVAEGIAAIVAVEGVGEHSVGAAAAETVPHACYKVLYGRAAVAALTYRSLIRICFWIPR
jgi:hypothetical protein